MIPSLAYAIRSLRRDPALVAGVVLTFALAIGANAAMFGLVTRLMLPVPPGVSDPGRAVRVTLHRITDDGEQYTATTTSYPHFQALEGEGLRGAFASVAAVSPRQMILGRGADAVSVPAIAASGRYFAVLGARPALGRLFAADDDHLPAGSAVAVLSYSSWQSRFAGRKDVIGRQVVLDGQPFTIAGVAPPNFSGDDIATVELFVPMSAAFRNQGAGWWSNASINLVSVIARLRGDVTAAAAAGLATSAARSVEAGAGGGGAFSDTRQTSIVLESLLPRTRENDPKARIAMWLFGVSLVVLVIATANVGTLLLLRALRKRRDVAIRVALGAGRGRLAMQLTTESLLLALAGGVAGLFVSKSLADVARATLLPDLAPSDSLVDPRVLAATMTLALLAGVVSGLAPIFLVVRRELTSELYGSGTLGSRGSSRAQRSLVGAQVALCTVLLVGAGLFVQSLHRVRSQELGFSTSKLLFVRLDFREPVFGARRDELHREVVARLARSAGVTGATVIQSSPFGSHHIPPISVPGLSEPPRAGGQLPILYGATPEYLRLMGVALLRGRLFTAGDRKGAQLVVLVNETMAREVWPGESALGKCIRAGHDPFEEPGPGGMASASLPCRTVVGVVRDSRARSLRRVGREASLMQYYIPFEQLPPPPVQVDDFSSVYGILVGVAGAPDRMGPVVQRLIQGGSTVPVFARVHPYQDLLDPQLRPWRLGATLFSVFGLLAVSIAAVGLFGVVSYFVTQRTREIGLRLALGGTQIVIGRSVVLAALRMVGAGVIAGLAVAAIVGPTAQSMLFETSPYDGAVLLGAAATLLLVTLAASAVPAWRAARVSPMTALRVD